MRKHSNTYPQDKDYLLRSQEVEQLVNAHRVSLLRWAAKNIAPKPLKIAGRWYWRNSDIQKFIAGEWEAK